VNDIKDLLTLALPDGAGTDPAGVAGPAAVGGPTAVGGPGARAVAAADVEADLNRGRRRLHRRRRTQATALTGAAASVAVAGLVVAGLTGTHPAASTAGATPRPTSSPHRPGPRGSAGGPAGAPGQARAIRLVAYQGAQAPGYQVAEVPAGWTIQGGNPYVLTLAPIGYPDQNIDSFIGKLVVMLNSASAGPPTQGRPDPVNGRPGKFDVQGDTQILTYKDAGGMWVVIQAPTSLGWGSAQLAQFASGVQVLGNAQQGVG
jgi:hypothetical protein